MMHVPPDKTRREETPPATFFKDFEAIWIVEQY